MNRKFQATDEELRVAEGAAWRARFLERAGESPRGSSRAVRARRPGAG